METKAQTKKGILGMDTVKAVMITFLLLGVIVIAVFMALSSITSTSILPEQINNGGSVTNSSANISDLGVVPSGVTVQGLSISYENIIVTINDTKARGSTNKSVLVGSGNYTINSTGAFFNVSNYTTGTLVNISLGWDYNTKSAGKQISENVTDGAFQFFENVPTVFVILGAVIIILAVSLIIFAVSRFSNGAGATTI